VYLLGDWLSIVNWYDWNMWAAFGQMIGAVATLWTAKIALKQIQESKRREKAALTPRVRMKVRISKKNNNKKNVRIFMTNVRPIPVYIYEYRLLLLHPEKPYHVSRQIKSEQIDSDSPGMLDFGDVTITEFPVLFLIEEVLKENLRSGLFEFSFLRTTGNRFFVTLYLEIESIGYKKDQPFYKWYLYYIPSHIKAIEEIKKREYFCGSWDKLDRF
jgi:hypothetical protein